MITSLIQVYVVLNQNKSAVTTVSHETMSDLKNVHVQRNPPCSQTWWPYRRIFNKSWWPAKFTGYFVWTRHLLLPKYYKIFMSCQKNLMMSVVCWNTVIFAPECWKYILRGPVFKFFPEAFAFSARKLHLCRTFFLLHLLQSFYHLLKILLKTLYRSPRTAVFKFNIYWLLHMFLKEIES